MKIERDRYMTEEKLINAVGELIVEDGFESLGVRKVAEQAGVNKTLIYRYPACNKGWVKQWHPFYTTTQTNNSAAKAGILSELVWCSMELFFKELIKSALAFKA